MSLAGHQNIEWGKHLTKFPAAAIQSSSAINGFVGIRCQESEE